MNEHSLRPTTMRIGQKFSGHHSLPDLIAKTQKIKHNKKSLSKESPRNIFSVGPRLRGRLQKKY